MLRCLAGNALWMLAGSRAHARFRRAWSDPRRAQEVLLRRFLRQNATTEYGRAHGYDRLRTVEEFRDAVPVVRYEHLEPWIERIRQGHPNVLTREPVLMMEKT